MQPRTITFASVLDSLEAAGMKFERVTPKEWVNRLRTGPQDPIENPPIVRPSLLLSCYILLTCGGAIGRNSSNFSRTSMTILRAKTPSSSGTLSTAKRL